ncbi:MAG: tetratricopeptide repeat protein [Xenococcaceae cyanobacterium]
MKQVTLTGNETEDNCLARANQLRQEGKLDEAIAAYQKAMEITPENSSRILAKLARVMMSQGNIEGAVTAYQKAISQAISQKPKQPKWFYSLVYTELGEALEKNGQVDEAIATYQEAIEILPGNSQNSIVHAHLGRAMMAQKNTREAIAAYQKAIALQPEQPVWVYVGLGDALNQNGAVEEAIAAYQKAIEYNSSNKQILVNDCLYQLIGKSGFSRALRRYFPSFDNIEEGADTNNKKKYLYCLNVNYPPTQILDLDNLLNRLPSEIKSLLAEGKCYLILDASNEGHAFEEKYGKAFHDLANILNCKRRQIIHLTQNELYLDLYNNWCHKNNLDIQNRIKIFTLNDALLALVQKNKEKYPVQNFNFINQRYREKKFLFLNNRPKVHRIFLLHQIIENNLLNNGLVSFNDNIKDGKEKYYKPKLKQLKCFLPHIGLDDLDRICQQIDSEYLPLRIDLVNRDNLWSFGRGPYMREIPLELYSQTYFSVISESEMNLGYKVKRFTEKSLKPFLGLHPFLIAGQPGTLKLLQNMGFKTFNGYIDESYDLVEDPYERANLIVEQLKNLCSMSQEELHNWYTELSPILFYNYGHFINRMPIWCKRDLAKKLEMISMD